jgi:hypothetical protein
VEVVRRSSKPARKTSLLNPVKATAGMGWSLSHGEGFMRAILALFAVGSAIFASTACSSTISTPPAIPQLANHGLKPRGWLSAKTKQGSLIYVAAGSEVLVFPERGRNRGIIGVISDQVNSAHGLFVDGRRNLYVANESTVTAYRPGTVHPYIVYSDGDRPLYIVLDHAGRLYAANQDGTVSEYPPHQTTPDVTFRIPGSQTAGISLDAANNLYVGYIDGPNNSSIEKFAPGSQVGQVLGMKLDSPQSLLLDRSGNILVVETGDTQAIAVFPPGTTSPSQVIHVDTGVTQMALRESEKQLYISNYANGDIYISRYPQMQFQKKIAENLMYVQGMGLSNEER